MTENEPADRLPGMDAEEYRRFQEFQRFQDYQRFVEGGARQGAVTHHNGTPQHGTASGAIPAHHEIAEHLAGVREHLAELATTQATINRTINPPLWRRILRSLLVSRFIWLGIVVIIAIVGIPPLIDSLINNLFADHNDNGPTDFKTKEESGMATSSHDAVAVVYRHMAENNPTGVCLGFSLIAELEFAKAANSPTCEDAVGKLAKQVTDPTSYGNPNLRELPAPTGDTDTISSCEFTVTGGPRLGTFNMTRHIGGWEIMDYFPPTACPPPTTATH